ncbi:MAG: cupredoxin domain-containing protein [Thiobacillus sp.]|nr:cupredoxin domain-containing protein [Thiobacillus sp.]
MKTAILFLVFCLTGYGACRADSAASEETVYRATIAADGVQHVKIEGGGYFFKPNRVIVKMNVPVELTLSMEKGLVPHTFVIKAPEAGIAVDEELSSTAKSVRFTPSAAGKFPFYCKNKLLFFESHRDKGMEGVLEVVE